MTERAPSSRDRSPPTWAVVLASGLVGMLLMWILMKVDFGSSPNASQNRAGERNGTGAESTDELARAAFDALKAQDFAKFMGYVVQRRDLQAMYDIIAKQGDSARVKNIDKEIERDGGLDAMVRKSLEKIHAGFLRAVRSAAQADVDWRRAEYGGLDHKNSRLREKHGVRTGRVDFFVRVGDDLHTFRLRGCANPAGRWMCGSGFSYVRSTGVMQESDTASSTAGRPSGDAAPVLPKTPASGEAGESPRPAAPPHPIPAAGGPPRK